MAAVAEGLATSGEDFGLAVIADNVVYLLWLPLLLASRTKADAFHRFTGVTAEAVDRMKAAAEALLQDKGKAAVRVLLYLLALGLGAAWLSDLVAGHLPVIDPVLGRSTWRILLVTTFGLGLSATRARRIPGSHELAMALVYLFVGRMGATANVAGLGGMAVPFVAALLWITIHGACVLIAAKLLKVDVHTAAIASAANIGGAASAPVVAAYHDERLVPVSVLMALIGYAVGNYAAFAAAWLCSLVASAGVW